MTPGKAIEVLERGGWWDGLNPSMSDADAGPLHEALEVAIAALRAQQEPVRLDRSRWKWCILCMPENKDCETCFYAARREELEPCKSCIKAYQDSEGERLPGYRPANFCPHCGRPLTEKAWGGAGKED